MPGSQSYCLWYVTCSSWVVFFHSWYDTVLDTRNIQLVRCVVPSHVSISLRKLSLLMILMLSSFSSSLPIWPERFEQHSRSWKVQSHTEQTYSSSLSHVQFVVGVNKLTVRYPLMGDRGLDSVNGGSLWDVQHDRRVKFTTFLPL